MANDKTSFVLYADLLHTVEKLPDELAGKLLKLILEYVNDRDPEPTDLTLQIAFEPIKRQMKRDLKKYEGIKTYRSEIGKLGGKRSAEAKSSKLNQSQANASKPNQTQPIASTPQANQAGTVNVNGTVNDIVSIKKTFVLSFPHGSEEFLSSWISWVGYRAEIKKPYQTFSSQQAELEVLKLYDEAVAIAMIQTALKNGWKNLRPIEISTLNNGKPPSKLEKVLDINQKIKEKNRLKYGS